MTCPSGTQQGTMEHPQADGRTPDISSNPPRRRRPEYNPIWSHDGRSFFTGTGPNNTTLTAPFAPDPQPTARAHCYSCQSVDAHDHASCESRIGSPTALDC